MYYQIIMQKLKMYYHQEKFVHGKNVRSSKKEYHDTVTVQ